MKSINQLILQAGHFSRRSFQWLSDSKPGRFILLLLVASLIFRWFYYIHKYSVNILFQDMWDFYEPFFSGRDSLVNLFTWRHGPHRQGIGFVLTKYIDQVSQWNTRWLAFTIGVLMLGTSLLYLRLKKLLFQNLGYFDILVIFIMLSPVQYGLFANTPNISHGAAPAMLLALFGLAWFIKNRFLRYTIVLILNFLLIYSAFGLLMGGVTPIILLLDLWFYRKQPKMRGIIGIALLISLLSLASFFMDYTFESANSSFKFPHDKPFEYLEYILEMMSRALGGGHWAGLLAIVGALWVGQHHLGRMMRSSLSEQQYVLSKVIVSMIMFSLVFMLVTSIGRVSLGLSGARSSRYTTYVLPAVLALYFHLCSRKVSTYQAIAPILLVFMVVKTTFIHYEVGMMKKYKKDKLEWKEIYLETGSIEKASAGRVMGIYPEAVAQKEWLQKRLDFLEQNNLNLFIESTRKPAPDEAEN